MKTIQRVQPQVPENSRESQWWAREDSNLQPSGYEPLALTIELRAPGSVFRPFLGNVETGMQQGTTQAGGTFAPGRARPCRTCAAREIWQGNRVKKLCSDEACEEVVIPSGDFAAEAERIFARGSPDQVEGHVLDGGEVGRGVIGADTAFVIAEHHVHDPMEAVLDD